MLNAANEVAVEAFLKGRLRFDLIPRLVAEVLETYPVCPVKEIEDVLEADTLARVKAEAVLEKLSRETS